LLVERMICVVFGCRLFLVRIKGVFLHCKMR
jgi:hypothetical protein